MHMHFAELMTIAAERNLSWERNSNRLATSCPLHWPSGTERHATFSPGTWSALAAAWHIRPHRQAIAAVPQHNLCRPQLRPACGSGLHWLIAGCMAEIGGLSLQFQSILLSGGQPLPVLVWHLLIKVCVKGESAN